MEESTAPAAAAAAAAKVPGMLRSEEKEKEDSGLTVKTADGVIWKAVENPPLWKIPSLYLELSKASLSALVVLTAMVRDCPSPPKRFCG